MQSSSASDLCAYRADVAKLPRLTSNGPTFVGEGTHPSSSMMATPLQLPLAVVIKARLSLLAPATHFRFHASDGGPPILTPIFKRWTLERSPPELHNHGFENMESMGAVYSRVSSHIFGDWNACGERVLGGQIFWVCGVDTCLAWDDGAGRGGGG